MKVTLAGLIKARREARGLTQAELGRAVGLSGAQISRIERDADADRWDPHWSTMVRLAVELDLSLDDVARTTSYQGPKRRGSTSEGMGSLVLVDQARLTKIERTLEDLASGRQLSPRAQAKPRASRRRRGGSQS